MVRLRIGFLWMMTVGTAGLWAQTGGRNVYNFLNFSCSPRLSALGNNLVSVYDDDPTLLVVNPSSIGQRHHNSLVLNMNDYFTNSCYGAAAYSFTAGKAGSFAVELRFVNYGVFRGADASGIETGGFSAGDYALTAGWGRRLSQRFSIGANLKLIYCHYESYRSFGLAADVAGSYYNDDQNLSLTLLARNIGSELKTFTPGHFEKTPFDLQFAMSQRLKHVPVRYHISLHSLYRWNMNYYGEGNPFLETNAITGKLIFPSKGARFFDNLFRHFVFGIEIEPSRYFSLQLAYNHNIHQDMKLMSRYSMAGFSYGFTLDFGYMQIGFSRLHYSAGAVPNCFSLVLNFDRISEADKARKARKLIKMNKKSLTS